MAEFDNMRKSLPVAYRTDKWVCDLLAAIQSLDDTQPGGAARASVTLT